MNARMDVEEIKMNSHEWNGLGVKKIEPVTYHIYEFLHSTHAPLISSTYFQQSSYNIINYQ